MEVVFENCQINQYFYHLTKIVLWKLYSLYLIITYNSNSNFVLSIKMLWCVCKN